MNLSSKIEAILFYRNEPTKIKMLAEILEVKDDDIKEALKQLVENLSGRGITIIENRDEVALATSKECSAIIEKMAKDEMKREIGKAGLETLAIILYKEEATRRDIDYIRGVNSSFILRNLLIRGLVDRVPNPKDNRLFLYRPTSNLLAHIGISNLNQLPNFANIKNEVTKLDDQKEIEKNEAENY